MDIDLSQAISLIEDKRKEDAAAHMKTFAEDAELEIMNGRFGPYIKYKGNNYKLPKTIKDPSSLTYQECMDIINNPQPASKPAAKKGRKGTADKA